jgi:hypothetical protein
MASLSSLVLFVGKGRSLPYSGAPERFFNRVGSCFTNRHYTKLERLAMDKHSSLLRTFVNYGRKKFYNIGPSFSVKVFSNICFSTDEAINLFTV